MVYGLVMYSTANDVDPYLTLPASWLLELCVDRTRQRLKKRPAEVGVRRTLLARGLPAFRLQFWPAFLAVKRSCTAFLN
jgi:hypothetical protein